MRRRPHDRWWTRAGGQTVPTAQAMGKEEGGGPMLATRLKSGLVFIMQWSVMVDPTAGSYVPKMGKLASQGTCYHQLGKVEGEGCGGRGRKPAGGLVGDVWPTIEARQRRIGDEEARINCDS